MACCERLRSRRKGSARSEHGSVMWRGLRPFSGSAKLATVAPWLPRKNRSHGMRRAARYSTTLYDYARAPVRPGRRRAKRNRTTLTVTDDWPEDVPVTEAEIAVFEAWFGELFDELF